MHAVSLLDRALAHANVTDMSKISISGRKVVLVIAKAGSTEEYWPRLLHSKQKQNNITVRPLSR